MKYLNFNILDDNNIIHKPSCSCPIWYRVTFNWLDMITIDIKS